ncbi:MAG: heat-inducible transcription repressor HrcA [Firmicutes bacterium HGW-Firmicutes-1]|jgi:heat-inducible transcriptional repressor|nr:MAG: heat-inducible transcription repressor HrcA [Firmicutes bacterium HGW-Firmicutes-1]
MELNDRKMKILQAIISSYFDTAEPVGSRTISKNYDLGISPATIRNEMSDLEELGFIVQPHTSSGRIPSDKGYRLYVDILLDNQKSQMKKIALLEDLVQKADRIENLLQDIVKMLAKETRYATMISTPQYKKSKIKNIQLICLEPTKLLAVVVTDGNTIKNYMIDIKEGIEQNVLNRLTFILNEHLYGLTLEQINLPLIQSIQKYADTNFEIITKVLDVVGQTIASIDDTDIYTSGTTNILKFPEFSDVTKAMELIDTFEEKGALKTLLYSMTGNEDGKIKIKIGEEIEVAEMKECSIITTSYSIGGEMVGAIGIIGPKRMDYMNTISSLKYLINSMEKKLIKGDKGS